MILWECEKFSFYNLAMLKTFIRIAGRTVRMNIQTAIHLMSFYSIL